MFRSTLRRCVLGCSLSGLVHADVGENPVGEALSSDTESIDSGLDETREELATLEARCQSEYGTVSEADLEECRTASASLREILGNATILLDDRADLEQRMDAARDLVDSGDSRVIPFVRAASRDESASLRLAIIEMVNEWQNIEIVDLLVYRIRVDRDPEVVERAFTNLQDLAMPEAGEVLYFLAGDDGLDVDRRYRAFLAVETGYPDLLVERGSPDLGTDRYGFRVGVIANGLAAGTALGSVGVWGQSDAGITIGALGGAAIGLGTGVLYGRNHPVSRGQGFRYASNVLWGSYGAILTNTIFDFDTDAAALTLTLGTTTGAITGFRAMDARPEASDVLESNIAGYLGTQIGRSTVLLGMEEVRCYWEVTDEDSAECESRADRRNRASQIGMFGGAAAGLGLSQLYGSRWSMGREDLFFASVVGAEAAWFAGWIPDAFELDRQASYFVNAGFHGGAAAAFALSHHVPIREETSALVGYGALAGNALGAGLALIPANVGSRVVLRSMMGSGIVGAVGGAWASPHLELSLGDTTMVGVGSALTMLQVGSLASVLEEQGVLQHSNQSLGLVLSTGALTSAALMASSPRLEPEPIDSLFLASSAAWGYWYSGLGLVALEPEIERSQSILVLTGSADLAMGLGAFVLSERTELEPRDTLVPQLIGVAGATLGSLFVALGSEDSRSIAWGALGGSTLGLVGGAALSTRSRTTSTTATTISYAGPRLSDRARQRLELPGEWSLMALPTLLPDGEIGGHVTIQGVGF